MRSWGAGPASLRPSARAESATAWNSIPAISIRPFGAGRPGRASRPAMRAPAGYSMTLQRRKEGAMSDELSDKKKPTGDYPIGYGKPPAQTRFKKGKSGHPTGRPKGTPNFATALKRALGEQVVVNEGGQRRTVSKLEATVAQLVN